MVVEAGEQSGSRAQARIAVEHGRPVILTSLVVERNDWARALAGRPGVHVAATLQAVLDIVDHLIAEPAAVGAALRRLAPVRNMADPEVVDPAERGPGGQRPAGTCATRSARS